MGGVSERSVINGRFVVVAKEQEGVARCGSSAAPPVPPSTRVGAMF